MYKRQTTYSTTAWGYANKVETFFLLFAKITMVLFGSSQMLLIIMALSTFVLFGKFILDNTTNVVMAILILLCESIFMQSFNLGRQLFSVSDVYKRQRVRTISTFFRGQERQFLMLIEEAD